MRNSLANSAIWATRWRKFRTHIRDRDWDGLRTELKQFAVWRFHLSASPVSREPEVARGDERSFWAQADWDKIRASAWGSIQSFGPMAVQAMTRGKTGDIDQLIVESLSLPSYSGLRGLVLGCGDMQAEHSVFLNPSLSFDQIDAYDINSEAFARAEQITERAGLKVNYMVGDANTLQLPPKTYHIVVILHSYHHFLEVDHVAQQINQTLIPGGLFYTFDYIGPRKLQHTPSQLHYAESLLAVLPERYRREINGMVRSKAKKPSEAILSPDEAINSDNILTAIQQNLSIRWQYNWAGLLYPLLEGIAYNFDETAPNDRLWIDCLFQLDRVLCQSNELEPNFTITLANKIIQ